MDTVIGLDGLFTTMRLGAITLPNRFVMPGMGRRWVEGTAPAKRLGGYYRRRAEGGVGLIISESVAIDHPYSNYTTTIPRLDLETVEAWRYCIDQVNKVGGNVLIQLWHQGAKRSGTLEGWDGRPTVSPSGLANGEHTVGSPASREEIAGIRESFVRSARLAQDAGAAGVEVHGAHGYLLDQFLWTATNRREDEYGGDIGNRVRLAAEVVRDIRAACGPDFVISFRLSQWKTADFKAHIVENPAELGVLADAIRDAGADVLHASTRRFWLPEWTGSGLNLAGWTRALSGLPTITVGSVGLTNTVSDSFAGGESGMDVEEGLARLVARFAKGEFDLVGVGRSLISDADWVRKVQEGRFDEIRPFTRADLRRPDDYSLD